MRVRRTIAFIDISGFTALTATHGDEEAVDLLTMFRNAVRQVCARRAVRVAKWLGDGAMLVSVDSRPALETVLELQHRGRTADRQLSIRCGITTGSVILLEGDDYIGHSVNLAARLGDLAVAHEILAVPELVPSLPAWGAVLECRDVAVRGLEDKVSVTCLGLPAQPLDCPTDPVCGLPLSPEVAFGRTVSGGGTLLFCSESCLDTWENRTTSHPTG